MKSHFYLSSLLGVNLPGETLKLIIRGLFLHFRDTFYVTYGLNGRQKVETQNPAGHTGVFGVCFSDICYQPAVLVPEWVCFSKKNPTVNTLYNTH